ncbi:MULTISPECIES: universal stress protein [Rhodococcus]|uniref:Universal stress protein n=1 Tax=Rhodococcus oxybenzonivorans TaxID=1990687 RepID=A0AAE5A6I9_9NOCA|nr:MULTISPECIES: universal stress protein [Rhodococcus]MDV7242088.1 universal stress protein [Rhodococcus oxybenzonivorans]MDV7266030.1 universal stress protein [Rhodococcus oxybenzonivorans]MDV7276417.1 universal stress protein [Rhodococcus oxybenzonivorans]MDV7331576.1 universal stress protein [Rhodococcus oxybenzonivorans]MDV7343798.1 universal stress protein [Rhodococcus oxybenzonivorans]
MAIAVVHRDSPEGRAAIVHAAREAVHRHEQLVVLSVVDEVADADAESDRSALCAEVQATLEGNGVGEASWELRTEAGDGDQVSALHTLVDRSGADLLVVGTRRMSPIGKFLLERWLQRLLLEVDIPVLVVKEELHGSA